MISRDTLLERIKKALRLRGGFPRSYLAEDDDDSAAWRDGFMTTLLHRLLGITSLRDLVYHPCEMENGMGIKPYRLAEKVSVVPLRELSAERSIFSR